MWRAIIPHDPAEELLAAIVEVLIVVGLTSWGTVRALRPDTSSPKPTVPRGLGLLSLAAVGILFALAAIFDPPFLSLVVSAGRYERFWSVVAGDAPLIVFLVLALRTDHELVVARFQSWWSRLRPIIARLVTGTALLAGTLFLPDAVFYFMTGDLYLPT